MVTGLLMIVNTSLPAGLERPRLLQCIGVISFTPQEKFISSPDSRLLRPSLRRAALVQRSPLVRGRIVTIKSAVMPSQRRSCQGR